MISAGELTTHRRQKLLASSPLPSGSAANLITDRIVGNLWRSQDGCCPAPSEFKIALVNTNSSCPPTYTCLEICTLLQFLEPVPPSQSITIMNLTSNPVSFNIGNGTMIPLTQLSYVSTINAGDTVIIPAFSYAANQTGFYYTDIAGSQCPNS